MVELVLVVLTQVAAAVLTSAVLRAWSAVRAAATRSRRDEEER